MHNEDIAGRPFQKLSDHHRNRILEYEFSTHVLPSSIEDRDVLEMFARLNATGEKLNAQELRNAEYFGEFKTLMYALAREQLDNWTDWAVFTDDQVARMKEVELTSDLAMNMVQGLMGKRQTVINKFYEKHDKQFDDWNEVSRRFRYVMAQIDDLLGSVISGRCMPAKFIFLRCLCFFTIDCMALVLR